MNANWQRTIRKLSNIFLLQLLVLGIVTTTRSQILLKQQDRNTGEETSGKAELIPGQSVAPFSPVDEKNYVGNVYGTVIDAETGQALSGVAIVLSGSSVVRTTKKSLAALVTDDGYVVLPRDFN